MNWLLIVVVYGIISADTKIERVTEGQCRAILAEALGKDDRVVVRCLSPKGEWFPRPPAAR